jgi:hypothetical protein
MNATTCRDACKRDRMAEAWQSAIFHPTATWARVVREVFIPVPRIPSHPVMRHWLRGESGWLSGLRQWWLERRVARIARVLLESLQAMDLIGKVSQVVVTTGRQSILVRLIGVSCREESIFVGALREIFDPLQSPRYLLVMKDEEFAVPRVLAEKKERAESFARRWRQWVGKARLLYVHTPDGKRRLLRAKERFLAARHQPRTESRMRWG